MQNSSLDEAAQLVALIRESPKGKTWQRIAADLLDYGSASAARQATAPADLFDSALEQAREDLATWRAQGLQFWPITDLNYPRRVLDIQEAPPFLFARGAPLSNDVAVSVVGSRDASRRGLQMATSIASELASMGVTVLSGLAQGIDTAAHTAALDAKTRTVAVIGTGINRYYPAANRELQDRIADSGLLLSQFWPDAPPQRHTFPMRNAVMSGYGIATVVVEASERSGARIQARVAVQHGRPVILTNLVHDNTAWAKELANHPDVHVASSVTDVTDRVKKLMDRPAYLGSLLSELAV